MLRTLTGTRARIAAGFLALLLPQTADALEYHAGPGQQLESPFEVPWHALQAGDVVFIHWREQAYRYKWVMAGRGTAEQPIIVRGVPGPEGQLPRIDGEQAVTPPPLNFWSEERAVIKIGGARIPEADDPAHIVIENLEIRGAHPDYWFFGRGGLQTYSDAASAIYVESGSHITIRNCVLRNCANGFFSAHESSEVLLEGCELRNNGVRGSISQHNSYTASRGMTYQFNRFESLGAGCLGNNLKDRSAGLVVRYNWIEGGNRQLDLVEGDDSEAIRRDPRYRRTFVYGNVLIEPEDAGNNQIVHYGGDNGDESLYRKGTLYLLHNTVVSQRSGPTTLVRLSTNDETAVISGNILYSTAAGARLAILDESGKAQLARNWIHRGWVNSHEDAFQGRVDAHDNLEGESPALTDAGQFDFRPAPDSPCIDAGPSLKLADGYELSLEWEFAAPRGARRRTIDGPLDLGAFESRPAGTSTR
ncbi:MAG: right-handed parallel beta-helix repeat-containing protein [Planctomycetaceae bacterium]|nr:right-handed parallel beta-helix repeat-containing protein [Planctomycetaceae bacterium]